ncbi:hypothetical protein F751_1948 [Auxenochlorella protothecoides]|uniref:Uncharacterized protein n=1 Tax=Auxenochlorella protothecoides TaxID=3075 RepID=A0A087SH65_AUXPR|nr:hypothetical protein F751_1948 [Auxenochlorella protothecoides]KFM25069.1 hypothetical protein F751_1948 [Auxenochlorella protothecoides]
MGAVGHLAALCGGMCNIHQYNQVPLPSSASVSLARQHPPHQHSNARCVQ